MKRSNIYPLIILASLASTLMTGYAYEVIPTTNSAPLSGQSCDTTWPDTFYVSGDGVLGQAVDKFHSPLSVPGVISGRSTISVYRMGDKVTLNGPWIQNTAYIPQAGDYVAFSSKDSIVVDRSKLTPSDRGKIILQIAYNVRSVYQGKTNSTVFDVADGYYYTTYNDNKFHMLENLKMSFDTENSAYTEVECHNIMVRWCGDGVVDAGDGEQCDAGAENGTTGSSCSASCKPVTKEPSCGDGVKDAGEACDPADTTHAGWGTNGCSASCKPENTTEGPVCASSLNGQSLSSPITAGQCDTGTPSGFQDILNGTTHNYSWKCEANGKDGSCTASYTPGNPNGPNLTIKKYAKEINTTGDSQSAPVDLSPGEAFNYYYVIENPSSVDANNVMVKDTFPEHLSWNGEISVKNPSGADVTSDWTCTKTTYNGTTRIALVCKKKTPLPANSGKYIFTVPVKIDSNTPSGTDMHNVAYICTDSPGATNPTGPNGEDICGNDNPPPPPPQVCTPTNNPQKDPACITIGDDETKLTIKKYAKTKDSAGDSQNADDAVTITPGETFNYYYVMKNEGSTPANGAIVKDTFPQYISIENIVPPSSDWTCTKGTKIFNGESRARAYLVCQTKASIPAGATLNFTITVKVANDVPSGTPMQNIAYVCEASDPDCDTTPPPPPGDGCAALPPEEREKDPACVFVSEYDLSVKKYIRYNGALNDANNSPGVNIAKDANFEYVIRVTNAGPKTTKNTTTVQDIIPTGVEITGSASGNGWSCSTSGKKVTCTSTAQIQANASFPDITIPVKVTTTSSQTILNIAAVDNPLEGGRCKADGSMPSSASEYCTKDTKNSDPAYLYVGDAGNELYYIHACFGSDRVCSIQYFKDREACRSGSPDGKCYTMSELSSCNIENYQNCTGNGNPYCGDGILQGGEECDLGSGNRDDAYCSSACKLTRKSITVPGENPILDTWIRIPNLSASKLGIGFMNYHFDTDPYKIVVGSKTPIFSVADTVLFGINQKYTMPLLLDVTRLFCLEADGEGVTSAGSSRATCTPIGTSASSYKTGDGKYVAIGQGDYFLPYNCGSAGCSYQKYTVSNTAEITLFKGSELYPDETGGNPLTLRDRFIGGTIGKAGGITLTSNGIDLVSIPVKISGAFISNTAGGTAYMRSVTLTESTDALLRSFLDNLAKGNFTTTVVGNANISGGVQGGGTTTIQNSGALLIKTDISSTGPKTITNCSDLASQLSSLNGNTGILVVKGADLTIDCELNLTGIRTILVQNGNLILKRNIQYQTNASTASWAFIVENGNVIIHPNVTNLAGVYIAIGKSSATGKITPPSNTSTTANILKVDGSLYGNANELVQNRSYVRGNNSYNVLTSGLIINYSSRAISYPPPLLTQYLDHYTVERVAQ